MNTMWCFFVIFDHHHVVVLLRYARFALDLDACRVLPSIHPPYPSLFRTTLPFLIDISEYARSLDAIIIAGAANDPIPPSKVIVLAGPSSNSQQHRTTCVHTRGTTLIANPEEVVLSSFELAW